MAEYINRDSLVSQLEECLSLKPNIAFILKHIIDILKEYPTADVVEVKHSEWKQVMFSDGAKSCKCCMACGIFVEPQYNYNYCPICGAKMDLKEGAKE